MALTRTPLGKVASYLFFSQPLIWVEGPEDLEVYAPLARKLGFSMKSADGKPEALMLVQALVKDDHPYGVILDGDYEILGPRKRRHRRVIVLHRHSMENYLFEKTHLETFCQGLARCEGDDVAVADVLDTAEAQIKTKLMPLVILDVAKALCGLAVEVMPATAEALFADRNSVELSEQRVLQYVNAAEPAIPEQCREAAEARLHVFLQTHRFVDLVNGHFLWSVIRRAIGIAVRRRGERFQADNRTLRVGLAPMVWKRDTSADHRRFMDRLRRTVTEIRKIR